MQERALVITVNIPTMSWNAFLDISVLIDDFIKSLPTCTSPGLEARGFTVEAMHDNQ
jgi:hypothetical protein